MIFLVYLVYNSHCHNLAHFLLFTKYSSHLDSQYKKLLVFWVGFNPEFTLLLQAQSLADPFAYDTYIERRKQEKQAAELASRITVRFFA